MNWLSDLCARLHGPPLVEAAPLPPPPLATAHDPLWREVQLPVRPDDTPTTPPALPRTQPPAPARVEVPVPDRYSPTKPTIQSILSVFETGKPEGDYGAIAVLRDGAGISYGLHQATDKADSLDEMVRRYVARGGRYADALAPFVPRLERDDTAAVDPDDLPAWVVELMDLLVDAADDPVMQTVQDGVFDEKYWQPAVNHCDAMELALPLSWAVVYDTCIHSGPDGVGRIRKRFAESPPSGGGDEQAWVVAYLQARYEWLSTHQNAAVRHSAQRILQLQGLVAAGNWQLVTPFRFGSPYNATIGGAVA